MADTPPPKRLQLPVFEGPLDLLLHLVKVDELEVTEIPLADVTRQYVEYLDAMRELNLDIAGDFLVMAATLLNIKSRALLPEPPPESALCAEEEIDEVLSAKDLIRRLVEYRQYKQLAQALRAREEQFRGIFYRTTPMAEIPGSDRELPRQDILTLFDAFVRVLRQVRTKPAHHVIEERFTVEEKIVELRESLRRNKRLNMTRVFAACVVKVEAICLFLAVLEMARLREITLAQADNFEDILIEPWDESVVYVG